MSRIAILYQDDTFGRAGLSGVSKAMEKCGMKLVAEGTFARNTTAVKTALLAGRRCTSSTSRSWTIDFWCRSTTCAPR
jgi:hypothetical protein